MTNVISKTPIPVSPTSPNSDYNPSKRIAPVINELKTPNQVLNSPTYSFEGEIKINLNNPNKEVIRNSFKVIFYIFLKRKFLIENEK